MFEVEGFWPTLAIGLLGGSIGELIRIADALKLGRGPRGREILGSILYALLGAGVVFYGWQRPRAALELAQLGVAFPLIFSAGAQGLARKKSHKSGGTFVGTSAPLKKASPRRSFADFMFSRF